MKVDSAGGAVATSSNNNNNNNNTTNTNNNNTTAATASLHKIKIKEEAKDSCVVVHQPSPPRSNNNSADTMAIGAITATITIGSCGDVANAVAKQSGNAAKTTTTATSADDFPVDLDLKSSKAKAAATTPREPTTVPREELNGNETRASSTSPSPSSSPAASLHRRTKATSRSSPSDSDDQALQPLKSESDEQSESKCEINGGTRCIATIFGAHAKLKRLLGTLVQFAMDISPDTGDTVRTLVMGLLSGSMSAEEFHSALQEATNFPLRGFVLPYLKHTLPALQRDLAAAARADSQSCAQYLRANESSVLEAVGLVHSNSGTNSNNNSNDSAVELFGEHQLPAKLQHHHHQQQQQQHAYQHHPHPHHHHLYYGMKHPAAAGAAITGTATTVANVAAGHLSYAGSFAAKRRAVDALYYENGSAFDDLPPYSAKRACWSTPQQQPQHHPPLHHPPAAHSQQQQQHLAGQQHAESSPYCWYSQPPQQQQHIPSLVQIGSHQSGYGQHLPTAAHGPAASTGGPPAQNGTTTNGGSSGSSSSSLDDEWKNIHVMLNCILGMVDKTKRALAILQRRGCTSPANAAATTNSQPGAAANGVGHQASNGVEASDAGNFKRLSGEIVAQTIRATEDRVAEVKRRAEEAVLEVKRAAVAEVQRAVAVAVAESRANERLRSQRYLESRQRLRPSPFLRLSESSATTRSTATASSTSSALGEDVDKEAHLATAAVGSSCWNCGRPALETCGGCGVARYCGSFCQHRDWEAGGHHATCASQSITAQQQQHEQRGGRASTTPSPTRTASTASESAETVKAAITSSSSASGSSRLVK